MTKYDKVCKALIDKTRNTGNWVTLTKNVNGSHTGKYALRNLYNNNIISNVSYNTLDEVIKEYDLKV